MFGKRMQLIAPAVALGVFMAAASLGGVAGITPPETDIPEQTATTSSDTLAGFFIRNKWRFSTPPERSAPDQNAPANEAISGVDVTDYLTVTVGNPKDFEPRFRRLVLSSGPDQATVSSTLCIHWKVVPLPGQKPIATPNYVTTHGMAGNDHITGCENHYPHEFIFGGPGRDVIFGGEGFDVIYAGSAPTKCLSGPIDTRDCKFPRFQIDDGSSDRLDGGNGDDFIAGSNGHDVIIGGSGSDWLVGGAGNDVIHAQHGGEVDLIQCGPGEHDTVYWDKTGWDNQPDIIAADCEIRTEKSGYFD